jgi:glycosyltransferase involved in cell wall biosynthesis
MKKPLFEAFSLNFHVLHMVPATPFGGLQRMSVSLAAEQRRTGLGAEILSLYAGREMEKLMETSCVPFTSTRGSQPSLGGCRAATTIFRRPWDLIHVHAGLLWCNTLALLYKNSPVVLHAHSYPPASKTLRTGMLKRINGSLADTIFAVSEDVARAWRAYLPGISVHCVYNGISLPPEAPLRRQHRPEAPLIFGMATRLAADKGLREFVEVAQVIKSLRPDAQFVIAGSGPEEQALRADIEARGLTNAFSLPGHVDDVEAFWNDVDVALFTAPGEPFGLRIIEPMRQGVPVAAYLSGAGSDEILRPGINAVAVPMGQAEALGNAACEIGTNETRREQMVSAAFVDLHRRFSLRAMNEQIVKLYAQLLPKSF